MPSWSMVNGVWRETWANYSRVNGVWRANNNYTRVNGIMRRVSMYDVEESDIAGFRMIYIPNRSLKHPSHPHLEFNEMLPIRARLTGDVSGEFTTDPKGIIFEYSNDLPEEQGIYVFEGNLFMVLMDNTLINVGQATDNVGDEWRYDPGIPSISEAWNSARPRNLSIQIDIQMMYEDYGFYIAGWNRCFTSNDHIDLSSFPDESDHKKSVSLNSYSMLPVYRRESTFIPNAYIGIARDMDSRHANMNGSHGMLDQTIHSIRVDGIKKPFIVEFYS